MNSIKIFYKLQESFFLLYMYNTIRIIKTKMLTLLVPLLKIALLYNKNETLLSAQKTNNGGNFYAAGLQIDWL